MTPLDLFIGIPIALFVVLVFVGLVYSAIHWHRGDYRPSELPPVESNGHLSLGEIRRECDVSLRRSRARRPA